MAKLKKNTRARPAASRPSSADLQAKAEHLSRSLVESAQQIWMAGVGAFTRAQGEGSKLFEALVTEGMNIEKTTRKLASGRVDAVRDAMEDRVGVVRVRASDTWDRLEKVFEDRVQRALNRLGIPGREELGGLASRVDALTAQLRKSGMPVRKNGAGATRAKPAKATKATRTTRGATAKKSAKVAKRAVKSPASGARKQAREKSPPGARKVPRKTLPRADRPVAPQA